jgi:uncharacterized membrane protein
MALSCDTTAVIGLPSRALAVWTYVMSRRRWYAGAGARTRQTGMVLALALQPTTFQRTLMPRSTLDQTLTTGICGALDLGFAALIQDTVEAVALRLSGATSPELVDSRTWRRASVAGDLVAIALGLAGQTACRPRPGERVPRGAVRTVCWWVSATGLCGAVAGVLQELAGRGDATDEDSVPAALAAGMLLAGVTEYRRRRSEAADAGASSSEDAAVSALKSLVMSLGVSGGLSVMAAGERVFATRVSQLLARVLSGSERLYRPVGHAAALSILAMAIYEQIRWVDHRAERMDEAVEGAFATAPKSSMVSGGAGSLVSWDSLSREGRRNVSTVLDAQLIERVMGEPAAEPIRVYVGLESAPTEYERRDLALRELQRTGAFDRDLLMVISPTGSGYVNYVAVEAAEYMTRGNIASVTMQYSLRPSALSLDRVAEGRLQYRMLIDAIHNKLAERPAGQRPRVVIFGESLGAWTSQDAFEHRGTQGLLDAAIDRAIWIGTPYMSKWKQEVLGGDRPDVDWSLLRRFNDFGQLQALDPEARGRLRYVMITHDNDGVADFGLDLLAEAPDWLGPAETRPAGVPKTEQWQSPTTFVQTLIDMKNSANETPGQFEAKGHDYRADLARFVREVYALQTSDEQLASIEAALRANELQRAALLKAHHPNQGDVAETGHPEHRKT